MIKRMFCAILTAVFLSVLCIPCGASDTAGMKRRGYSGFADVPTDSLYFGAVKACYEAGLMNGVSETSFAPQGKLTIAQLVVLAARLYDLQNGGDGAIPALPDLTQPYVRYRDADGTVFASLTIEDSLPCIDSVGYVALTGEENAGLPETCTLEVGYEGYNHIRTYSGVRETYHSEPGYMDQGFRGTGYRFESAEETRAGIYFAPSNLIKECKDAWWFPAAFYLGSEGRLALDGGLIYRTSGGNSGDDYDPLTRFSQDYATRSLFAWLVDLAAGDLPVLNETVKVPDVDPAETQDADAILRLYQAGVLTGVDKAGNFNGSGELTRAQAAMMLDRVLDEGARVKQA